MTTVHIEAPITDFDLFKSQFDRNAELRRKAGVQHYRVQRPVDDPATVVIDLDFPTIEQAEGFLYTVRTKVWPDKERSSSLAGTPRTRILEPAEEKDVT
ncbi:hypothetical protein [Streptomyces sp. WMMC1477]|uniref:hypothetical protein n=1 Tax=Streptomyces sp. WMMC1477 TaxID=3015155 RepID=UPI0022B6CE92|nr:hypothetical protein [Streptomyces sp. WMMC1477]MCZ7432892.1 hypothetical protein [Streptomyces sp. WMMC1477]